MGTTEASVCVGADRERAAGYYSEISFAVAQVLVEVPYLLAQAVLFSVIRCASVDASHALTRRDEGRCTSGPSFCLIKIPLVSGLSVCLKRDMLIARPSPFKKGLDGAQKGCCL